MFSWSYEIRFSFFILDETDGKIPISKWDWDSFEYLQQLTILKEFCDNGFAEITTNTFEVENNEILKLSEIDKQILYLPDHYPYDIWDAPVKPDSGFA